MLHFYCSCIFLRSSKSGFVSAYSALLLIYSCLLFLEWFTKLLYTGERGSETDRRQNINTRICHGFE